MSFVKLAQVAKALTESKKRVSELETEIADYEKRAAAEGFLLDMMQDPRAPLALRPSSVADFMEKRAAIEKQDLEVAKLAAKMASSHGFEIGDPDDPSPLFQSTGSRADDEFLEYLLTSGQG